MFASPGVAPTPAGAADVDLVGEVTAVRDQLAAIEQRLAALADAAGP